MPLNLNPNLKIIELLPQKVKKVAFTKVASAALFIVIVMALVIGILCSAIIFSSYYYKLHLTDNFIQNKLQRNCTSAINLILEDDSTILIQEKTFLDLFDKGNDSVCITKRRWGLFEIARVNSFQKGMNIVKTFMYGYKPGKAMNSAIYLIDYGRPLSISGKTVINGDVYLPEAGGKRAYIEGQSFQGEKLFNGKTYVSEKSLPKLNEPMLNELLTTLETGKIDSTVKNADGEVFDSVTIQRTFSESSLLIELHSPYTITDKTISNNVIIWSDTLVTIDASTKLEDVLIYAPAVKILDGFTGSLQIFAKDSVAIGKECNFLYPSSIGIFKSDYNVMQPYITIGEKSKFSGIIFSYQKVTDLQQTIIKIEKEAEVTGVIFGDGYVDVKGSVYGNVTCNKFLLKTPSSIYENHLLNVTIDRNNLSDHFIGSSLIFSNNFKGVVKYLDE